MLYSTICFPILQRGCVIEQTANEMVELQLGVISPADDIEITLQYAVLLNIDETGGVRFVFPTFLSRKLQSNYTGQFLF